MSCFLCCCEWTIGETCSWSSDWYNLKSFLFFFFGTFHRLTAWLSAYLVCVCLPLAINLSFPYDWFSGLGIFTDIRNCSASHPTFPSLLPSLSFFIWQCRTEKKEEPLARNVRSHRYSYIAVLFLQATSLSVFKLKEAKIYILYFCQTQQYLFILLWQHVLANWPPSAQIYKTQNKLQSSANNIFVIWYPIKFLFQIIYSWYVSSLWYIRVVCGCV